MGIGSLVRVPLGGRKVRGYVVEITDRPPRADLRTIGPTVMKLPLFDRALFEALAWAAHRYVAPLAVLLERAAPPNLANRVAPSPARASTAPSIHPVATFAGAVAHGRRRPPLALIQRSDDLSWVSALAGPVLAAGKSCQIVAATGVEVEEISGHAGRLFPDQVVSVRPESSGAETTAAWVRCQTPGHLLIGSPRIAPWPIADLALAVAVEEGRRAMKDRQTPTISVRDFLRTRSNVAGNGLVFAGPTPSLETIAGGATILRARPRAWPPVEVVDLRAEPDSPGLLGVTAVAAIKAVLERKGRVFVFAHRKGYAPAARCQRCRTLRRCPRCGARPETSPTCPRCGAELGPCANCQHDRFVPLGAGVGRVLEEVEKRFARQLTGTAQESSIQVGSESDLAGLEPVDLAIAVDADGLILGTNYRATEEALRILARLVGRVAGRSSRGLIQTSLPDHPVIRALRAGDPVSFLEEESANRQLLGLPPTGQLLIVELRGEVPATADAELHALGAGVTGPVLRGEHHRWLLQGNDLGVARKLLRPLVQRWRDAGTTVRIDADPLDL